MTNPVLVEMVRGPLVESIHRGSFVVARADGTALAQAGNTGALVFPRSSYKMMQALPLVATGAADACGLGPEELSLACASHSSEPMHTERVKAWLAKLGLADNDLECGAHPSRHEPTRDAMIRAGEAPQRVHNNCSGKHAGFLTVAKHLGVPTKGYTQLDHPVQQEVTRCIAEICEVEPSTLVPGTDGCAAPNLAMPLKNLALGFARMATPSSLSPDLQAGAKRLTRAVADHPLLMSGTGRACAELIMASKARALVKVGAEGVYGGMIPDLGLGIALKIDDGATRGAETAIAALLVALGMLNPEDDAAKKWLNPPWRNTRDQIVGEQRPAEALKAPITH
jgi:L-asparaginase II